LYAQTHIVAQPGASAFEEWVQSMQQSLARTFADQVTPVRLASHIAVLLVAAIILILSNVDLPTWDLTLRIFPNSSLLATDGAGSVQTVALGGLQNSQFPLNESLQRAAVPFTTVHAKPTPEAVVQTYIVQAGDTVLAIAEKYHIRPETVQWSNPGLEVNADIIRPGDPLRILPIDGAIHTVTSGDTLTSIAGDYEVTVEDIVGYAPNKLADASAPLPLGMQLVIPNGVKPYQAQEVFAYAGGGTPVTAKIGSGAFAWPSSGTINQRYWGGHAGIDIGAWTGAAVTAADGGYVAVAAGGWNAGYGNHIIVDHGNGFVTLYAHLNSIFVKPGENVARGQQIGSVGNTGNSTGPHLHFEIRYQGSPRNPANFLP
jgi:murein DD-endopeptidase MepM/ murein hydrolase activator NlpD